MSSISSCPRCAQQVMLPPGATADATVRCPLCQAEYPLQEALAGLPPMLEVVSSGVMAAAAAPLGHGMSGYGSQYTSSDASSEDAFASIESSVDSFGSADSGEHAFTTGEEFSAAPSEVDAFGSATSESPERGFDDDEMLSSASSPTNGQSGVDDFGFTPASQEIRDDLDPDEVDTVLDEERRPTIKFSERLTGTAPEPVAAGFAPVESQLRGVSAYRDAAPAVEGDEFELDHGDAEPSFRSASAEDEGAFGGGVEIKPVKRKKRREPSAIGNFIGVVGGGLIGLTMGYYFLLLIGGPEKDLLGKADYFPKWMLPKAFSDPKEPAEEESGFAKQFPSSPPQVAQVPQQPKQGLDTGFDNALNVPALPGDANQNPNPRPVTSNKPVELEMPSDKPDPSTELTAPSLDVPLITPPVGQAGRPNPPKVNPEEPAKPEMPAEKPEPSAVVVDKPKPEAPPKTDDVPPADEIFGLKEPRTYTADELTAARTAAEDGKKALADAVGAGASLDELKPLRQDFFKRFFQLGEVVTFTEIDPADPKQAEARENVVQTVLTLAASPSTQAEIGRISGQWWGRKVHGEQDGIMLSGVVESSQKAGKLYETKIKLLNSDKVVIVLSQHDPQLAKDDVTLVLGSIVDEPALKLHHYSGEEPSAVWSGLALKLPPAEAQQ